MAGAARRRLLLLDVPLGILVAVLCVASAQVARFAGAIGPMRPSHDVGRGHDGPMGWPGFVGTAAPLPTASWLLGLWVLLLALAVAGRRIRPRIAYLTAILAGVGYLISGYPLGPVMIAPALVLLAMAQRLPTRRWVGWIAALVPFVWAAFIRESRLGLTDPGLYQSLLFGVGLMILPALIGLIRHNREDAQRRTRELELRRSAFEERLRIARDVHDVIGHSLSVITMQAGVALYLLDSRPEQAETSLRAIKTTSKNALDELRATLAVFRDEDYDGTRAPVAGLDRLPELIEAFRAGGRRVAVIGAEDLGPRPAATDLAGYRIVQESLTNVARHTRDADSRVELRREGDRVHIMISNDGPSAELPSEHDGTGIAGMIERARGVGGALSAGPRRDGGFLVEAWLPLTAPAALPLPTPAEAVSAESDALPTDVAEPDPARAGAVLR